MTDEVKANIKYILSDIGEQVGVLALEYISELEKENRILRNDIRVPRDDRERLMLKIGNGLKDYIHDCPYSSLKLYASSKFVEENKRLEKENARLSKMLEMAMKDALSQSHYAECNGSVYGLNCENVDEYRQKLEKRVENEK